MDNLDESSNKVRENNENTFLKLGSGEEEKRIDPDTLIKVEDQGDSLLFVNCVETCTKSCSLLGWMCCKFCTTTKRREIVKTNIKCSAKEKETVLQKLHSQGCGAYLPENKGKLLVFINPNGGPGEALSIWESVKDILLNANFTVETVETTYYKHAYNYLKEYDISGLKGIVALSGDGILHEIVNSLKAFHFPDEPIPINLGIIPGGSGNAKAAYLCYLNDLEFRPDNSVFLIARQRTRDFGLLRIEDRTSQLIYAFMTVTWGIISDIDLESECIRFMGSSRFDIWGVRRLFSGRKYHGVFREGEDLKEVDKEEPRTTFGSFLCMNIPLLSHNLLLSKELTPESEHFQLISLENTSFCNTMKYLFSLDSGKRFGGAIYKDLVSLTAIPLNSAENTDVEDLYSSEISYFSIDGEKYDLKPVAIRRETKAVKYFS